MIKPYLLPLLLAATPLHAETSIRQWEAPMSMESYVELHEPTVPKAVATVTFKNSTVHSTDETFSLTYEGLVVGFIFDWQYMDTHSERLTVEPPEGYVAIPYEIVVDEDDVGYVHIYKWEGM